MRIFHSVSIFAFFLTTGPTIAAEALSIPQIQGSGSTSSHVGEVVKTTGVVVGKTKYGQQFVTFVQDPAGDGDPATSDGIAAFTSSNNPSKVGDLVTVIGTVAETKDNSSGALTLTSISPAVIIKTGDGALPTPVQIGSGDYALPDESIADGDKNAIALLERLEAMNVSVADAQVVGPINHYGELWVLPDNGAGASGLNSWGGITATPGDFNPERVEVSLDDLHPSDAQKAIKLGDRLASVEGALGYTFGNYEIVATKAGAITTSSLPALSPPASTVDDLTVGSYNVENLDTQVEDVTKLFKKSDQDDDVGDGRFAKIGDHIVHAMGSPDIVALQEIQDDDGGEFSDVVTAGKTLQTLVDAIKAAGGPIYKWTERDPVSDAEGGQPGGNIRVAVLYNPDRVTVDEDQVQRIADPSFRVTRLPLAVPVTFKGHKLLLIDVHLSSKGGSDPLYGAVQPPMDSTVNVRVTQARAIRDFVRSQSAYADRAVVILGDFNTLPDEEPLQVLTQGVPTFDNLTLKDAPTERFSYIFEGNGQALDHILVDAAHSSKASFEVLHVNSPYPEDTQASDHDPKVMVLSFN